MEAGNLCTMATCVLNQWAMDFAGNKRRILASIVEAKRLGASYRLGPELEISGYGCSDHFYEGDTFLHSWQVLHDLLIHPDTRDIVCDVGMPVRHHGVAYNCRVVFLNGRVLLIRPKTRMAEDGNYRESRWFSRWTKRGQVDHSFQLPEFVESATGQATAPFGDAVISFRDASLGFETCEEVWTIGSTHIDLFLDGVDIVANSSGSHHQLRKLNRRVDMISSCTNKAGGLYLYSNARGCDGERVYYDGAALIALNGKLVAQSRQFALEEVEVTTATVDLEDIRNYRHSNRSHCQQSAEAPALTRIDVPEWRLCGTDLATGCQKISLPMEPHYHSPEEEISLGPACWMWDYLRRSGQAGFFLPLSGGIDSTATSCLVYSMSVLVFESVQAGSQEVLEDLRRIVRNPKFIPASPQDICSRLFTTCYMGSENSSKETRLRAERLSKEIGAHHLCLRIDTAVAALIAIFVACTGLQPKFRAHGGSAQENLALQNVQARVRMVLAYLFAQLVLLTRGISGNLLVLGSANLDEGLRGYMTKYDCSSADINPIGGISKSDLRSFIRYIMRRHNIGILGEIFSAPPTAELEPLEADGRLVQTDEADMGMTYDELSVYGRLRKLDKCGPLSMFIRLRRYWPHLSAAAIADKVKHFFRSYSINRHKLTILTPSYHAEAYGIDDNRFDHRQFLYNVNWPWQFEQIDLLAARMTDDEQRPDGEFQPPPENTGSTKHRDGGSHTTGAAATNNSNSNSNSNSNASSSATRSGHAPMQTNNAAMGKTAPIGSSVGYQGCVRLITKIGRQRAAWRGGVASTPIPSAESAAARILAGSFGAATRRQQRTLGRVEKRASPRKPIVVNYDDNQRDPQAALVARLTLSPRCCVINLQEPTGKPMPPPRMRLGIR